MDVITLAAAIQTVKKIPGSAAERAEAAATAAEAAAAVVEQYAIGVSVSGTTIVFTSEPTGGDG